MDRERISDRDRPFGMVTDFLSVGWRDTGCAEVLEVDWRWLGVFCYDQVDALVSASVVFAADSGLCVYISFYRILQKALAA